MLPVTPEGAPAAGRRVLESPIHVERWPSEVPLAVVVGLLSALIWIAAVVSIIGIIFCVSRPTASMSRARS